MRNVLIKTQKTLIKTKAYLLPRISDCLLLSKHKTKGYCVGLFVETWMAVYHKVSYLNVSSSTEEQVFDGVEDVAYLSAWEDPGPANTTMVWQVSPWSFREWGGYLK